MPIVGTFEGGARSDATAMRTAKRDGPSARGFREWEIGFHLTLVPLPARQHHPPSVGPTESVQFCTDAAAATSVTSPTGARGNGQLPMNDAQRYRMNAADCLSAAERCGPDYRDLTLAIASSWLSLARHQCQSAPKFDPRIASSANVTLVAQSALTIECGLIQ